MWATALKKFRERAGAIRSFGLGMARSIILWNSQVVSALGYVARHVMVPQSVLKEYAAAAAKMLALPFHAMPYDLMTNLRKINKSIPTIADLEKRSFASIFNCANKSAACLPAQRIVVDIKAARIGDEAFLAPGLAPSRSAWLDGSFLGAIGSVQAAANSSRCVERKVGADGTTMTSLQFDKIPTLEVAGRWSTS